MTAAREPITFDDLGAHLHTLFPQAAADRIDRLLRDLVGQQILITSLWAPMTTMDAFGHLCAELERLRADTIPDLHDLVTALYDIHDEIAAHQPASAPAALDRLVPKMRAISRRHRRP